MFSTPFNLHLVALVQPCPTSTADLLNTNSYTHFQDLIGHKAFELIPAAISELFDTNQLQPAPHTPTSVLTVNI